MAVLYNMYLAFGQLGLNALHSYQPEEKVRKIHVAKTSHFLTKASIYRNGHQRMTVRTLPYYVR